MKFITRAVFLLLMVSGPAYASGDVVADLSSATIAVNTGFAGTTLTVFGLVDPHDEVVVAVEGPDAPVTIRQKSKHLGFWVADTSVPFQHAPKFFALATSKPFIASPSVNEIAVHGLALQSVLAPGATDDAGDFREALIRIQEARGLYNFNAGKIEVKSGRLFRADFDLPVNVPIGTYRVHIAALRSGAIVAARALPLTIDESGIASLVQHAASEYPFVYAFVTLFLVLAIGAGSTSLSVVRKGK